MPPIARLLLLLLCLPLAAAAAPHRPPPFEATYRIAVSGLTVGQVRITLRYDGDRFEYAKRTVSKGLAALFRDDVITEVSRGRVVDGRFVLEDYRYEQRRKGKSRVEELRLRDGRAEGHYKGRDYVLDVPPGTLDRSSVELALMRDAGPERATLSYPVVERGKFKTLRFTLQGEEDMSVPAGEFSCLSYHVKRQSKKRDTTLCLAPALHNLPLHARHIEKGTRIDMTLRRYRFPADD